MISYKSQEIYAFLWCDPLQENLVIIFLVCSLHPSCLLRKLATFLWLQQIYRKNIASYVAMKQVHKNVNWLEAIDHSWRMKIRHLNLHMKRYDEINRREKICHSTKGQKTNEKYVVARETREKMQWKKISTILIQISAAGRSRRAQKTINWWRSRDEKTYLCH